MERCARYKILKFVSDFQQVGGFFMDTLVSSTDETDDQDIHLCNWTIVESGVKHPNPNHNPHRWRVPMGDV
jgi:hypothetical protein